MRSLSFLSFVVECMRLCEKVDAWDLEGFLVRVRQDAGATGSARKIDAARARRKDRAMKAAALVIKLQISRIESNIHV